MQATRMRTRAGLSRTPLRNKGPREPRGRCVVSVTGAQDLQEIVSRRVEGVVREALEVDALDHAVEVALGDADVL